jgi:hypothetical protein
LEKTLSVFLFYKKYFSNRFLKRLKRPHKKGQNKFAKAISQRLTF